MVLEWRLTGPQASTTVARAASAVWKPETLRRTQFAPRDRLQRSSCELFMLFRGGATGMIRTCDTRLRKSDDSAYHAVYLRLLCDRVSDCRVTRRQGTLVRVTNRVTAQPEHVDRPLGWPSVNARSGRRRDLTLLPQRHELPQRLARRAPGQDLRR